MGPRSEKVIRSMNLPCGSAGRPLIRHLHPVVFVNRVLGFATGAYLGGALNTDISRMTFVNSVVMAVQLVEARHNTIRNTRVSHDFGDPNYAAILLYHSDSNLITMNVLTHNGDGISLDGASHNTIAGNTSSDSGVGVVLVNNSDSNTITANHTDRNMDSGVLLDRHADSNRIDFNEAAGNGFGGVVVGASDHNTVLDNMTDHNPGSGVVVTDNARATLVQGNHANNNGGTPPGCTPQCPLLNDGIHVDATTTTLRSNVADSNADLGIDAVHRVIDGGGNEAHANGNPLKCKTVLCRP
jgi:parallel beta-helix repeat protein